MNASHNWCMEDIMLTQLRSACCCRSESCAMVMMASSWSESDSPCAIMVGSAVNQDGRASSLTAPNGPSQAAVIREALTAAGTEAAAMHSLHLHGTGTSLVSLLTCLLTFHAAHELTTSLHDCQMCLHVFTCCDCYVSTLTCCYVSKGLRVPSVVPVVIILSL